jgi:pyrroloquinoline-quinone synthase
MESKLISTTHHTVVSSRSARIPQLQYGSTSNPPNILLQCAPRNDVRRVGVFAPAAVEAKEMANTNLLARLDAAIAERNLLNHPFYQDWQAGKLSREALQLYATQYYRHVEAFPKHLRVLAARTEGPLRETVMENLAEEENPEGPHPKLWRDFASALGVAEEDISCCPALPGTQTVVATFREICGDRPVAEAVAALYAYEGQVPEIASTKIDGLKKFYGIDQPEALAYFTIHEEADKAHRAAWRGWLEEHAEGNEDEIVASAQDALNALWGALDAVHCKKRAHVN